MHGLYLAFWFKKKTVTQTEEYFFSIFSNLKSISFLFIFWRIFYIFYYRLNFKISSVVHNLRLLVCLHENLLEKKTFSKFNSLHYLHLKLKYFFSNRKEQMRWDTFLYSRFLNVSNYFTIYLMSPLLLWCARSI